MRQLEFYKANPNPAAWLLQSLFYEAWLNETFSNEWAVRIIVKIPKKGNLPMIAITGVVSVFNLHFLK